MSFAPNRFHILQSVLLLLRRVYVPDPSRSRSGEISLSLMQPFPSCQSQFGKPKPTICDSPLFQLVMPTRPRERESEVTSPARNIPSRKNFMCPTEIAASEL
ncbi:hypothetical protein E2C01_066388 [Portunus trituberculatus]|uniref:Secreted protein n=1 Tax=Portunus trituberculatus TaxID=210409 RepID=A0A5B7HQW8_PORTR|nr:hypothetical protein [Portunus trituberculatus]